MINFYWFTSIDLYASKIRINRNVNHKFVNEFVKKKSYDTLEFAENYQQNKGKFVQFQFQGNSLGFFLQTLFYEK